MLCNFIHSRYFFTNKKSFHSLVSMTERQRRRQIDSLYADYSTLLPKETFFRGKYEYKDEKRTVPKNTRLEIAIGKCRGSHSISLKAFSTIFHNFSFKIFLHCNYPPSKIFKKDEPIWMNIQINKFDLGGSTGVGWGGRMYFWGVVWLGFLGRNFLRCHKLLNIKRKREDVSFCVLNFFTSWYVDFVGHQDISLDCCHIHIHGIWMRLMKRRRKKKKEKKEKVKPVSSTQFI